MTTLEHRAAAELARPTTRTARRRRPPKGLENWWRHVVGLVSVAFALFPIVYVISAAFNADQSLGSSTLIPRAITLDNFRTLFTEETNHYVRWYVNSLVVAGSAAVLNVILGALAAYAFSRFRFRGRRLGLMALLLVQMFPQLLLFVAIYLIVLRTGEVVTPLGLNTLTALIAIYLAGAMGVNAWLMKGYFDTIPPELDESARVDGATPAQVFWGVILPLTSPVLAVVGIITFVFILNEFIIAGAILQTNEKFTLPLGLRGYIDKQYSEHWGPFAAGVVLAAIPPMIIVVAFQRFFVRGLTQGAVKG